MVRPATPGTVLVLAAAVCLVLVSVSTPIVKQIYFLQANLGVSVASVQINGRVKLGVFGYCVEGIGTSATCIGPQIGYELNANQIFGNTSSINIPNSLIKWLTYALIIHPIAAGLAVLAFVLGVISHFREFSRALVSTWIASLASTLAMLAFIFDMVAFSIAKSRLNSANTGGDVQLKAELGNGIWLTLVGFIFLFLSSCSFGCGHRMMNRRPRSDEKEMMRPRLDYEYASQARKDALDLEKRERDRRRQNESGLPAFPEEEQPLTAIIRNDNPNASDESVDISGVGLGYGRTPNRQSAPNAAGYGAGGRRQASNASHAEPFTSMYDTPQRQPSGPYDARTQPSDQYGDIQEGEYEQGRYGAAQRMPSGQHQQQPPHRQPSEGYSSQYGYGGQQRQPSVPPYDSPRRQPSADQYQQQFRQQSPPTVEPMPMPAVPQQHGGRQAAQYAYPTREPTQYQQPSTTGYAAPSPGPQQRAAGVGYVAPSPIYPPQAAAQQYPNIVSADRDEEVETSLPYASESQAPQQQQSGPVPWLPPVDPGTTISIPQGHTSFAAGAGAAGGATRGHRSNTSTDSSHYAAQPSSSRMHFPQPRRPGEGQHYQYRQQPAESRFASHAAVTAPSSNHAQVASPPYEEEAYDAHYVLPSPQETRQSHNNNRVSYQTTAGIPTYQGGFV